MRKRLSEKSIFSKGLYFLDSLNYVVSLIILIIMAIFVFIPTYAPTLLLESYRKVSEKYIMIGHHQSLDTALVVYLIVSVLLIYLWICILVGIYNILLNKFS